MKLGLFGDSFGFQKHNEIFPSWVSLLSDHYDITNHCECGISEYKILMQLKKSKLDQFDKIIITHTSPTRIYVKENPIHMNSQYYKNCDIIFSDIEHQLGTFADACRQYFKYIFDIDYAKDIHSMICKEIADLTKNHNVLHITHFDYKNLYQFDELIDFYNLYCNNKGPVNHYNQVGNETIYKTLLSVCSK